MCASSSVAHLVYVHILMRAGGGGLHGDRSIDRDGGGDGGGGMARHLHGYEEDLDSNFGDDVEDGEGDRLGVVADDAARAERALVADEDDDGVEGPGGKSHRFEYLVEALDVVVLTFDDTSELGLDEGDHASTRTSRWRRRRRRRSDDRHRPAP